MNNQNNNTLAIAITFAAIIIAGALVFFALELRGNSGMGNIADADLSEQIDEGIQAYIEKQQEEARQAQIEANKPKMVEGDFSDDDAVLGDPEAPVTMIEFSDYECPYCKRHFTQTLPLIKEKYIDTGQVKLIFRDFPLAFHDPLATQQAMAAECVREQTDDETYFAYHDLLFETTTSNGRGMEVETLYELAGQLGVNNEAFAECLESEKYKGEVANDLAEGQSAGITGTPGFLINGKLISGAQSFATFEQVIEEELRK